MRLYVRVTNPQIRDASPQRAEGYAQLQLCLASTQYWSRVSQVATAVSCVGQTSPTKQNSRHCLLINDIVTVNEGRFIPFDLELSTAACVGVLRVGEDWNEENSWRTTGIWTAIKGSKDVWGLGSREDTKTGKDHRTIRPVCMQ